MTRLYLVAGNLAQLKGFDEVAWFEILEVGEPNTAFETFTNFTHIVLESAQRSDGTLPNNGAVAQESNFGAACNNTSSHCAACDSTNLWRLEHFSHFGFASDHFFELGREHALHRFFDVFDEFVNDFVGANLDAFGFGQIPYFSIWRTLNPISVALVAAASAMSFSVMAPTAR